MKLENDMETTIMRAREWHRFFRKFDGFLKNARFSAKEINRSPFVGIHILAQIGEQNIHIMNGSGTDTIIIGSVPLLNHKNIVCGG